jgi:hypothetical protein
MMAAADPTLCPTTTGRTSDPWRRVCEARRRVADAHSNRDPDELRGPAVVADRDRLPMQKTQPCAIPVLLPILSVGCGLNVELKWMLHFPSTMTSLPTMRSRSGDPVTKVPSSRHARAPCRALKMGSQMNQRAAR